MVQVSSSDPKAAARAAAILKVYHKYIENGSESQSSPARHASASDSQQSMNTNGNRILDELLAEAEAEVSIHVARKEEMLEGSSFDTTALNAEVDRRERSVSTLSARRTPKSAISARSARWTKDDWRQLEQCFVDERRRTRELGVDIDPARVVNLFLDSEQISQSDCTGEWAM